MDAKPAEKVPPERDFGGTWIVMGERQYKVPPLNFAKLREFQPKIEAMKDIKGRLPSVEEWDTVVEIVETALKRNYATLDRVKLETEMLDVGNFRDVFDAILGSSGIKRVPPGE